MEVYVVFETDQWLSSDSYCLLGVGLSLQEAVNLCVYHAADNGVPLNDNEISMLNIDKQTQGSGTDHDRHWNYDIIECKTNECLI